MRQFIISALITLLSFHAFGQQTLKGKVTDEKGNPLQGATVVIAHTQTGKATDANGQFVFNNITQESVTLNVRYIGFEPKTITTKTSQQPIIALKRSAVAMSEVTVSSLRAGEKSPIAYSNLSKEDIQRNNLGQDIPYLLAQTPSLVVSSDAGTGIGYTAMRIRGTDPSRINVTINGIPYNDADEQGAYWVDLPDFASSLENIQIQRGVGTSTNGAAAFGANINLQTDNSAQKTAAEATISGGSFNTLKATVKASTGLMNGHWSIDTRLSSIQSDGYIDRGWVKMKSYFVQAGYYGEKSTVKFITFGGKEQTYHAWDGVDSYELPNLVEWRTYNPCGYMGDDTYGNPLYYKNQTDNYIQTHYQLIGTHVLSPELTLSEALHYTRGDGYYEEYKRGESLAGYGLIPYILDNSMIEYSDLVRQKLMGNDFGGAVFSLNYKKDKLNLVFGGGLNCYNGKHWGEVIWVQNYVGSLYPNTEYYHSKVRKWDGNLYLKANYDLSEKLSLYADLQYRGVRYMLKGTNDNWDASIGSMQQLAVDKKFSFFNPKAGLYYKADQNNDLYGSFAVAHREPTRTNYTDGNPGNYPTAETLYDTELGWKHHGSNYAIGLNGYFMNYKDQLILTGKINDIGEALTENIAHSFRTGLELTASYRPFQWLNWAGTCTYSYNRIKDFTETVNVLDDNWAPVGQSVDFHYKNTPIAYTPSWLANSVFTFNLKPVELAVQSSYVGKQYVDNTGRSDRALPSYLVNNLRITYTIPTTLVSGVSLSLMVNNLFDAQYISNAWSSPYIAEDKSNPAYNTNSPVINYFGCYPQAGRFVLGAVNVRF